MKGIVNKSCGECMKNSYGWDFGVLSCREERGRNRECAQS